MAEAEEVISDAARHATVFVRDLWRRHQPPPEDPTPRLTDLKRRLDLFLSAVAGASIPIRVAQPPRRPTLLEVLLEHDRRPRPRTPLPATDGLRIWLPPRLEPAPADPDEAVNLYRVMALQQLVRARRGSALRVRAARTSLERDLLWLIEICDADAELVEMLPGMAAPLQRLRRHALAGRPPVEAFPPVRRPLEAFVAGILAADDEGDPDRPWMPSAAWRARSPEERLTALLGEQFETASARELHRMGPHPLLRDLWTGVLLPLADGAAASAAPSGEEADADPEAAPPPSGQLERRPDVREAQEGEDDDEEEEGAWLIQLDEPHLHAEDPMGLQRPTDRDEETSADEYADLASELGEARLVATPGRPKEILLSDDPPDARADAAAGSGVQEAAGIAYPEWDWRSAAYRTPGATVRVRSVGAGDRDWVDRTLARHGAMLHQVRRRFELLRAERTWQRRQTDGDEIDLDAWVSAHADFRAGQPFPDDVYRTRRTADRALAITLLIDVSGSTDSWIGSGRRVIDVEREALLLVCVALEGLGEPFSVEAFSGQGPDGVVVRPVKGFDEPWSDAVALRISALQPEHYTRAGAPLRHAAAGLMRQAASHRLLLLLSDGKPNDVDDYEGRYGVEDMRQAVIEARLQDIHPFCLTIDRQAADYLPRVFGAHQYALLPEPERLPLVLLDWIRRLLVS
jgi:nitric oxide reductase NorD protein